MGNEPESSARWRVIHHLLQMVNRSGLGEIVVLRGSLLMKAWYGDAAREPNDVDLVLRDPEIRFKHRFLDDQISDFLRVVQRNAETEWGQIRSQKIKDSPLSEGEYAHLVGRRLMFPWEDGAKNTGIIQVDIAFDERLHVEPSLTEIPNPYGEPTVVYAAGKDEALAWKLLWLQRDAGRWTRDVRSWMLKQGHPSGKDLYDAVLLAEDTFLPLDLYLLVTGWFGDELSPGYSPEPYHNPDFPLLWDVDWESFQRANPQVEGTAFDWQMRLAYALEPTFTDAEKERAMVALSFRQPY